MFLTAQNLFYYLRDAGLACADDVTSGDFGIVEVGRRNRNFIVLRERAGSLFVKQVPGVFPETVTSFRREAACAQLAHEAGERTTLGRIAPRLRRYDATRHVLVYDAFEQSETLTELVARTGAVPAGLPGRLALIVAACHLESARPGALAAVAPVLSGDAPWVFIVGEKAEMVMPNMSPGCRQVVDVLRATPELLHGLAVLGAGWRRLALMHGDLKWDNVLLVGPADGERELRLIDWELADLGDPLWDVASVLGSFLQFWVLNVPAQHAYAGAPAVTGAVPLETVRGLAGEFWHAYAGAVHAAQPLTDELALRVGRLAGARLVLLAFELLQGEQALTPHAQLALRLARYFLADPARAMADLLGIGPAAPWKPGTLHAAGA